MQWYAIGSVSRKAARPVQRWTGGTQSGRRHECEADAGVPGRRFDERRPRPEQAHGLGVVQDGERDAVLDAPAGVHVLELGEDATIKTATDAREFDERRSADCRQDRQA